jgi:hypothetical protein
MYPVESTAHCVETTSLNSLWITRVVEKEPDWKMAVNRFNVPV